MRRRSLNFRLTAASIAAVALAVLVFGVAARVIVSNQMHSSLDRSLRQRATEVARLSVSAPAVLTSPGALESPISGRQLSVEVLDRRRTILARSLALGAKLLPRGPEVAAALRGSSGFVDAELDGEPIRVFAAPIAEVGGPASGGVVLVASSTADIEDTLHRLSLLLALCGALAIVAGGVAAALLTRRSVRPLRELSSSATAIERTGDPSRRLAEPATPEEIGELARTLNRMLTALEHSRERERRFLADASHELRTPLTSLIGNVDFLARHGAGEEVVGDRAEIAVTDAGAGFPPGSEEVAFERFWRGDEAAGKAGSGIGLAIVRATAERHGGEVRARGATVTVTLPIAAARTEAPEGSPAGADRTGAGSGR